MSLQKNQLVSRRSGEDKLKENSSKQSSEAWLRFIRDRRWSRRQKMRLINHFACVDKVLEVDPAELHQVAGGRRQSTSADVDEIWVQRELAWLQNEHHHLVTWFDPRYPVDLREIDDPPLALFACGKLEILSRIMVSIVGSRRPSPVGAKVAEEVSATVSKLDMVVVSGAALGIDGLAHAAALGVGRPTIAVLGCGIDVIYPNRNRALMREISQKGLLLSEFPMGYQPNKYTFPDRNRIVSGLSAGVVIVEAAERSGTLITARLAVEQNRELMVVPGPALSQQYRGSHRLIQQGAGLVCDGRDVVDVLAPNLVSQLQSGVLENGSRTLSKAPSLSNKAQRVFDVVDYTGVSVDIIIQRTELCASEVASILLELELGSMVATTAEGGYIRVM